MRARGTARKPPFSRTPQMPARVLNNLQTLSDRAASNTRLSGQTPNSAMFRAATAANQTSIAQSTEAGFSDRPQPSHRQRPRTSNSSTTSRFRRDRSRLNPQSLLMLHGNIAIYIPTQDWRHSKNTARVVRIQGFLLRRNTGAVDSWPTRRSSGGWTRLDRRACPERTGK